MANIKQGETSMDGQVTNNEQYPETIEKNGKIVVWMTQAKIDSTMEMIGEKIAEMAGIKYRMSAMLVFEELFVNIANYAYRNKSDKPVVVKCIKLEDSPLQISLIDCGKVFDPTIYECRETDAEQIGGHGIRLVRQLADKFEYERKNGQNIVTVYLSDASQLQ